MSHVLGFHEWVRLPSLHILEKVRGLVNQVPSISDIRHNTVLPIVDDFEKGCNINIEEGGFLSAKEPSITSFLTEGFPLGQNFRTKLVNSGIVSTY